MFTPDFRAEALVAVPAVQADKGVRSRYYDIADPPPPGTDANEDFLSRQG